MENIYSSSSALPKEEILEVKQDFQKLRVGIPKETSFQENRISLTPDAVSLLIHNGHQIVIESKAGVQSNFRDDEYLKAGAEIVFSKEEVYETDIIVKLDDSTVIPEYNSFQKKIRYPLKYNLKKGTHTLYVQASDNVGNRSIVAGEFYIK